MVPGSFEKLLEPGRIGRVQTRNKMFKTAADMGYSRDGFMSARYLAFYEALARGGAGLIVAEYITPEYPLGSLEHPHYRLDDDKFIPGVSKLTQVIHKYGCPTFVQMLHAGPWHSQRVTGLQPIASSHLTKEEIPNILPGWEYTPFRVLTTDEIKEMVEKFAITAERAQKAGFDGVEINASASHLINNFLSRIFNKRQDLYGCQNLENRTRFLIEIIKAIKKRNGQDFPVTVLFNGAEFGIEKGTTVEEGQEIARILQAAGADALNVRGYGFNVYHQMLQPENLFYPEPPKPLQQPLDGSRHGIGATVPVAAAIKKAVSIPVMAHGRLDPVTGEQILRDGKADFIGMTRRLMADPELPNKVAAGRLEDIAPCTACSSCGMEISPTGEISFTSCRVNAALGSEEDYTIKPAKKKKKVLVIGGGPAGMEAARVAAIRGHEVILYEKEPILGGLISIAAMVKGSEIEDLPALIKYLKTQVTKDGVDIHLGQEFKPSMLGEIKPDAVVLASGGITASWDIPGINRKNVIILSHLDKVLKPLIRLFGPNFVRELTKLYMPGGKSVIVIGGAYYGCELAEFLVMRGKKVTIVEKSERIGEGMPMPKLVSLSEWFEKKGVTIITGVQYKEITNKGLAITTREGRRQTIEADSIMPSTLLVPNTELLKALKGKVPEVYAVGDCTPEQPRLIKKSITAGYRVANAI